MTNPFISGQIELNSNFFYENHKIWYQWENMNDQ